MKILITGASGFLGVNLVKRIIDNKEIDMIYCVGRSEMPVRDKKVIWIKSDIREVNKLRLDDTVDVVVHLAAYLKYESKKMFEAVNVNGTENIIAFCKNNGINRIIHCSTINVKLRNKGGYATTKMKAEKLIESSGLNHVIVRPTLIYGQQDKGLNKMISSAKKFGVIPVFGKGGNLQQPVYVDELAVFFEKLIFCDLENTVLELGGLEWVTYMEMVDGIKNALGKNVYPIKIPAKIALAVLSIIEFLNIPFMLRREQIWQNNEDLICQNEIDISAFQVKQSGFIENLRKYVRK